MQPKCIGELLCLAALYSRVGTLNFREGWTLHPNGSEDH